eukprot:GHRQ01019290.1.p1 GENE.GHRQ01019290.1~~GHRQ01019290.1.p1  ORF type:complete len:122 (+),score=25.50 GHRQ01019290.1:189-554(+)
MSGDQLIAKFAARRPDWELPQLQLEQLQLHPFDALEQATSRQPCPKCHKSRFLYCYDCAVAFTPIPSVQLPFQLSIITHHAELASKNTGVRAFTRLGSHRGLSVQLTHSLAEPVAIAPDSR